MSSVEIWRPIPGYSKYYVSNLGNIRSSVYTKEKILKQFNRGGGYLGASLFGDTGIRKQMRTHQAVLLAFVGAPPPGHVCDHINGNIKDNRLENLVWVTPQQNLAKRNMAKGAQNGCAKLTESDLLDIIRKNNQGTISEHLAREYKVDPETIRRILIGKTWKHLTAKARERMP
jgi:hypothetical protein